MWVKICANTSLEDAALAARLGADAVGFVFAASKRQVTAGQVAAITPHLPATLERVGVFDSRNAAEIEQTTTEAGLGAVQLHNTLDLDLLADLSHRLGPDTSLIQTLHWRVGTPSDTSHTADEFARAVTSLKQFRSQRPVRILVDSKIGGASGGTGVPFDWKAAAAAIASAQQDGLEVIVAGGLNPANVAEAVQRLQPWGVDVASGVEAAPGGKDPARLASFLKRAHGG